MDSTFLGIEIGKRSLLAHRKALNVTAHNLANSNNEAYSRQRIIFETTDPLYRPQLNRVQRPGQIGQGVDIASIRRERDIHLDGRIYQNEGSLAFWQKNVENLREIEETYKALGETNLQEKLDAFWSDWQNLSLNPSEPAAKIKLVESTKVLTSDIRQKYHYLSDLRKEIDQKVIEQANNINDLTQKIAYLNQEILKVKTIGDNPNDLLDKRDGYIEELSQIVNVKVSFKDNDEMMLYINGDIVVQGGQSNELLQESDPNNEGLTRVYWQWSGENIRPQSGALQANLLARDQHVKNAIDQLNVISNNLIYSVNEIHREGFNTYGEKTGDFFKTYAPGDSPQGNFQTNVDADGVQESTLLYQIKGGSKLDEKSPIGSQGIITLRKTNEDGSTQDIEVSYQADEKIEDVIKKLNLSDDSLNFFLDFQGKLSVKSRANTPNYPFSIPYLADSGDFLVGIAGILNESNAPFQSNGFNNVENLNQNASFSRTPLKHSAAWIDIADVIKQDSGFIATRGGVNYDTEDGFESPHGREETSLARAIVRLRHDNTLFESVGSFNEYYTHSVVELASKIKSANNEVIKYEALLSHLEEVRQSVSGVSVDEELSNMIAFQQGYESGARIVRIMDEMLDTLINKT